ncbi:MAG: anthranilate phosphoribosyltransferase [Xanthomonadales bacterium]|nr:anthranilate phosphoribosyltransferase [Xanthomonadales bacterium]
MEFRQALEKVISGNDLTTAEMTFVMHQIMTGQADDAQIGGLLVALRMKGESLDEIEGAVQVMRSLASGVTIEGQHVVDIVGTGGDGLNLFNISTAACFVVAAAGGRVAKHGNRSVSSSSGSADLLETAGVKLDLNPQQVRECVQICGLGFMFAPAHHSAMKHAIAARKSLSVRTLFNILGPMTNPAGVKNQLIGVYDRVLARPMAEVLRRLGSGHVLVVHSEDGLDEISLAAPTFVVELKNNEIHEYTIQPEDYGIERQSLDELVVNGADASYALIRAALAAENNPRARAAAQIIGLNAGAALYVAGLADNLLTGIDKAMTILESGEALAKLDQLIMVSHQV